MAIRAPDGANKTWWVHHDCDNDIDKGEYDDKDLVWLSFAIASGAKKWLSKVDFFKMRISTASPSIVQWWWSWSCLIEFCNCNWSSSQSALQREVARVTLFRLLFQHLFVFCFFKFLSVFFFNNYLLLFYFFVCFSIEPYISNVFFLHIISFTSEARSNTTFQMRR